MRRSPKRSIMADGTKAHSSELGVRQNEISIALGFRDHEKPLLGGTVNHPWKHLAEQPEDGKNLSVPAVIVSDGAPELRISL